MNLGPYQDDYGKVRKVNSRKPIIPLKYSSKHKAIPNEIILDINNKILYGLNDDYELVPLGGNSISMKTNNVSVTSDTSTVDTGLIISEKSTLLVTQNGMRITEGINYKINGNSIEKLEGVWNGDLEQIIFNFVLFENSITDIEIPDNTILPTGGQNGQVLIKTDYGMAWADVDITKESYETIVMNTLGEEFIFEGNNNKVKESVDIPNSFPKNGTTGQVLTRTVNGMAWADVDITREVYEDIVNDTIGNIYIIDIENLAKAVSNTSNLKSNTIPEDLPQNGYDGQVLYKTAAGAEWKDLDITDTSYRSIISNTLGDSYI